MEVGYTSSNLIQCDHNYSALKLQLKLLVLTIFLLMIKTAKPLKHLSFIKFQPKTTNRVTFWHCVYRLLIHLVNNYLQINSRVKSTLLFQKRKLYSKHLLFSMLNFFSTYLYITHFREIEDAQFSKIYKILRIGGFKISVQCMSRLFLVIWLILLY